ncbi:hypothetical protein [Endozoicomonas arenosclerae]|uniref:hypothetical protein n=1 Tax=Endozoicomonas arenosclerae TaxID=1633495 RepID=UPI0007816657|nr:hypothetical protein [Endozoicomonas arenosclerae]
MSMLKDLGGKTYTAANGQQTYEVFYASASLVPVISKLLQENFGFEPVSKPAISLDEVVAEVEKDGIKLGLGWDNWSGAYVMGFCEEGSKWVNKLSHFLDDEFEKPKYRKYVNM